MVNPIITMSRSEAFGSINKQYRILKFVEFTMLEDKSKHGYNMIEGEEGITIKVLFDNTTITIMNFKLL